MILINNNWEYVNDIHDVIRITSECISEEFGRRVNEIFENLTEEIEHLEYRIDDLESQVSECEEAQDELDDLTYEINEVKRYIKKKKEDSEFINGMKEAIKMITK